MDHDDELITVYFLSHEESNAMCWHMDAQYHAAAAAIRASAQDFDASVLDDFRL